MELVRKIFILETQFIRCVKIIHFNARHVYIDIDNKFDYQTILMKLTINIEGHVMRIKTWTPDFTPEKETPIAPIWVAIPGLRWHYYKKVLLATIFESLRYVLFLDSPSS